MKRKYLLGIEIFKNILVGHKNICGVQVQAEIDVINASWNPGGTSNGLADTIGLMVYEGDQVSCDWWRAGHVTTVLTSDWSAGAGRVRVLQWNHLSQTLGTKGDNFVRCEAAALQWAVR